MLAQMRGLGLTGFNFGQVLVLKIPLGSTRFDFGRVVVLIDHPASPAAAAAPPTLPRLLRRQPAVAPLLDGR